MSEQEYLKRVKSALIARGIWGASARKMIEQLSDHYRSAMQELREDGKSEQEARKSVEVILGSPETLAHAVSQELHRNTLLGRHPWLVGGVGFFLGVFGCAVAILLCEYYLSVLFGVAPHDISLAELHATAAAVCNWVPWTLGCLILAWLGWRLPVGWNALIVVSAAVGLSSAAFFVAPQMWPSEGLCNIIIYPQTWLTPIVHSIFLIRFPDQIAAGHWTLSYFMFGNGNWATWVKLLFPLLVCLTVKNLLQNKHAKLQKITESKL